MLQRILAFVRGQRNLAKVSPDTPYRKGYVNALGDVEEYILDEEWREGIDDDGEVEDD